VRVRSQLGLKLNVNNCPVRAPVGFLLFTYQAFLPNLVADGEIEHYRTRPVAMGELSLQPLDVIGKSWTE
jgi:hypothetical protein